MVAISWILCRLGIVLYTSTFIIYCCGQDVRDVQRVMKSLYISNDTRQDAKLLRPVEKKTDSVEVNAKMFLQKIHSVDMSSGFIELTMIIAYRWTDFRLRWDANEYGGVNQISVPVKDIWQPDMVPMTSVRFPKRDIVKDRALVNNSGEILWQSPSRWKVHCKSSMLNFPVDEHNCTVVIVSLLYGGHEMNMTWYDGELDLSSYVSNSEWILKRAPLRKRESTFGSYVSQRFYIDLILQRNGTYYNYIILLPVVLVAVVICVLWCSPSDSKGRMTIAGALMMSLVILVDTLKDNMGTFHDVLPAIGFYYCMTFGYLTLSTLVFKVINCIGDSSATTKPLGNVVRRILSMMTFLHIIDDTEFDKDIEPLVLRQEDGAEDQNSTMQPTPHDAAVEKLESDVNVILKHVRSVTAFRGLRNSRYQTRKERKLLMAAIDRILCALFVLAFLIYTFILLT